MKKYFVGVLLILLGSILGTVGTLSYLAFDLENHKTSLRKANSIIVWSLVYKEALDEANNPNHDIAIYALERALRLLKAMHTPNLYDGHYDCRIASSKYAQLHMELSKLYAKKGEADKEADQLDHALAEYKKFGWIFEDTDELQKAHALIEKGKGVDAVKQYGSTVRSACYAAPLTQ